MKISQISRVIWVDGMQPAQIQPPARQGDVETRGCFGLEGRFFQAILGLIEVRFEQLFQAVGLLPVLRPDFGRQAAQ